MDCKIRDKVLYCSELFEQAPAEDSEIQDAHKRFEEWYTTLNADQEGTASLDERLRDVSAVRDATLNILNDLVRALEHRAGIKQSPDTNNSSERNEALGSLVENASVQDAVEQLESLAAIFIQA